MITRCGCALILKGKESWFLPFNKGWHDGAGNPPNPHGLKTDYLWKEVLTKRNLTDILENYAQVVQEKDERGPEEAPETDPPSFPPTRRGPQAVGGGEGFRARKALSDPTFGRVGQEQFDCLARPSDHRLGNRRQADVRHRGRGSPTAVCSTGRSATRSSSSPRCHPSSATQRDRGI